MSKPPQRTMTGANCQLSGPTIQPCQNNLFSNVYSLTWILIICTNMICPPVFIKIWGTKSPNSNKLHGAEPYLRRRKLLSWL
jgi:hypothetical protein